MGSGRICSLQSCTWDFPFTFLKSWHTSCVDWFCPVAPEYFSMQVETFNGCTKENIVLISGRVSTISHNKDQWSEELTGQGRNLVNDHVRGYLHSACVSWFCICCLCEHREEERNKHNVLIELNPHWSRSHLHVFQFLLSNGGTSEWDDGPLRRHVNQPLSKLLLCTGRKSGFQKPQRHLQKITKQVQDRGHVRSHRSRTKLNNSEWAGLRSPVALGYWHN